MPAVSSAFAELEQAAEMTSACARAAALRAAARTTADARPALVGAAGDVAELNRLWSGGASRQHGLSEQARRKACRLVGEDELDGAAVATELGVGWDTIMRAMQVPVVRRSTSRPAPAVGV